MFNGVFLGHTKTNTRHHMAQDGDSLCPTEDDGDERGGINGGEKPPTCPCLDTRSVLSVRCLELPSARRDTSYFLAVVASNEEQILHDCTRVDFFHVSVCIFLRAFFFYSSALHLNTVTDTAQSTHCQNTV